MATDVIEVTFGDGIVYTVEVAFTDLAGLSRTHPTLTGRDEQDQHPQSAVTGLVEDLAGKADLVGGKVPAEQLPDSAMEYKGDWDASTNTPALANGTGDIGDYYYISKGGTADLGSGPEVFKKAWNIIYNGSVWRPDKGSSLNSILFEVDSNSVFPVVSQLLVENRVRVTCVEIIIEEPFDGGKLSISHGDDPVYVQIAELDTSKTGSAKTYLLYPGINTEIDGYFDVTFFPDSPTTGRGTVFIFFSSPEIIGDVSTGKTSDSIELPGLFIPPSAPSSHAPSHVDGTDQIPSATSSSRGLMDSTDWNKLDSIEPGATGDLTGPEIKSLYESQPDTNAFTDSEKANLSNQTGINTGDQDLSGLEPEISPATDEDYYRGDKVFSNFAAKTRSVLLTGLNLAVGGIISAGDAILEALGKLQVQITEHSTADNPHPQYVLEGEGGIDEDTAIYVLSYDKEDNSQIFNDLSVYNHAISVIGSFRHTQTTPYAPIVGASSVMIGDGSADYLQVANHSIFNSVRTWEFYFRPEFSTAMGLISMWDSGAKRFAVEFQPSQFRILTSTDGSTTDTNFVTHSISTGDFTHFRIVFYEDLGVEKAAIAVDGTVIYTFTCGTLHTSTSKLHIAAYSTSTYLNGRMDLFRGTVSDTSRDNNFVPPTTIYAYSISDDVRLNSLHRMTLGNPHQATAADIGADPVGTATSEVAAHALTSVHSSLSAPDGDPSPAVEVSESGYTGFLTPSAAEYPVDVYGTARFLDPTTAAIRVAGGDYNRYILRVDAYSGETPAGGLGFTVRYMGSGSGNSNALYILSDNQYATPVVAQQILQDGKVGFNVSGEPVARVQVRAEPAESALLVQDQFGSEITEVSEGLGFRTYSAFSLPSSQTILLSGIIPSGIIHANIKTTSGDVDISMNPANTEQGNIHIIDHVAGTNTLRVTSTVDGVPNQVIPVGSKMFVSSTLVGATWEWRTK